MGRRKIEIRAIKDDRNRSVTFLKRKGGLFKKAHELSVLCSVDVAVIIFGHNKKLYEFSSGDIQETLRRYQYYGPPHEHKGPADFKNKGGDDDDDDEDDEDMPPQREDSLPPQHNMMAPHLQHHNSFQHIQGPGSSASPPMQNGVFQPRNGTPQPQQMGSRPSSRNTIRRPSSNLVPMQHPHPTPTPSQNGFAYQPSPPIYNPQAASTAHPSPQPPQFQFQPAHTPQPQHQQLPNRSPYMPQEPPHQPHPPHPPHQQHQQHQPHQPPQPTPSRDSLHPPPLPVPAPRSSPQPQQQEFRSNDHMTPPQITHLSSKSRSIFTPIDEGGSVLAHLFFGAPDPPRQIKRESPPDMKRPPRQAQPPQTSKSTPPPPRPQSSSSFRPPTRSDTGGSKSGASRPKLNLQIPLEASDGELTSTSPQARSALNSANPAKDNNRDHPSHMILPPPSPSHSAVLSAGVGGPPNPFARPPPPTSNNQQNTNAYEGNRNTTNGTNLGANNNNNNNMETPISALPSRYMDRDLLASPGGIFGVWGDHFGPGGSNILPSPNVGTPQVDRWTRNVEIAEADGKRKGEELGGEGKRLKT